VTVSLKGVCSALGAPAPVSVCRDILGFKGKKVGPRLDDARPQPLLSLNGFVAGLRDLHFDVQLILAGVDVFSGSDDDALDYAVYRLRDIYKDAKVGVGRITRQPLTSASSLGHVTVRTKADLDATGKDLTSDGAFIPVVIPANMNVTTTLPSGIVAGIAGQTPTPGPCSPRTGSGARSSVVGLSGETTGRTLAHEIGHFFGIPHPSPPDNSLMTQTNSVTSGNAFTAVTINPADIITIRTHCTMLDGLQIPEVNL
jgi:hypothetical protein